MNNNVLLTLTSKIGYYDNIPLSPYNVLTLTDTDFKNFKKGDIIESDIIKNYLKDYDLNNVYVSDKNYDDIYTNSENKYLGEIEKVMQDSIYKLKFVTKNTCKILEKNKRNISILVRFESYNIDEEGVINKVRDDVYIENLEGLDI